MQGRWPTASLSGSDTRDSAAPLWPATEKREAAVGFRQMLLCLILPFLQECVKMLAVITTEIKELCLKGHQKLLNKIPLVGWDVAITENGIMILECNLSCNFFCGEFNKKKYFDFVEEYFKNL